MGVECKWNCGFGRSYALISKRYGIVEENVLYQFRLIPAAVALVLLAGCTGGAERQAEYLARAEQHFADGNLEKAKIDVRNALQIDGDHAEGRLLFARVHGREENFRQMYANLMLAVELDPKLVDAHNELAALLIATQAHQRGLEHAQSALSVDPENAQAHALVAAAKWRTGERDAAIVAAERALQIDAGNVEAIGVLTQIYQHEEPELALQIIEDGIKSQDENALLKLLQISVLEGRGSVDEGARIYRELIAENDGNLYYYYRFATYLQSNGRGDEAEALIRGVVNASPEDIRLKLWLAQYLANHSDLDNAASALEEYIDKDPDSPELSLGLAQIRVAQRRLDDAKAIYEAFSPAGDESEAAQQARGALLRIEAASGNEARTMELLEEIFEIEPENEDGLNVRARMALTEGRVDDAIADLRLGVKNNPQSVEMLSLLAQANAMDGADDLSIDNYQQILQIDPGNKQALVVLTRRALKQGENEDAINLATTALRNDPTDANAAGLLIAAFVREEQWGEAIARTEEIKSSPGGEVLGSYLRGRIHHMRKEWPQAIAEMERAIDGEPRLIEALQVMVQSYVALDKRQTAVDYLTQHLETYPNHSHALELMGELSVLAEDYAGAERYFRQSIASTPKRENGFILLGQLKAAQHGMTEALDVYQQGLESNSRSIGLLLRAGEAQQMLGKYTEAASYYETAVALRPVAAAQNNLAMLYADHLRSDDNLNKALSMMRQHASSEVPAFQDTLGWVHYRLGNNDQAMQHIEAAIEGGLEDPAVYYHMGMVKLAHDDRPQAIEHLKKALAAGVEFDGEDEARRALEEIEGA